MDYCLLRLVRISSLDYSALMKQRLAISEAQRIDRGYEKIVEKLTGLGATIERVDDLDLICPRPVTE